MSSSTQPVEDLLSVFWLVIFMDQVPLVNSLSLATALFCFPMGSEHPKALQHISALCKASWKPLTALRTFCSDAKQQWWHWPLTSTDFSVCRSILEDSAEYPLKLKSCSCVLIGFDVFSGALDSGSTNVSYLKAKNTTRQLTLCVCYPRLGFCGDPSLFLLTYRTYAESTLTRKVFLCAATLLRTVPNFKNCPPLERIWKYHEVSLLPMGSHA